MTLLDPLPAGELSWTAMAALLVSGGSLAAIAWQRRLRTRCRQRLETELLQQSDERQGVEDTLRRTLAMFQMLQDITAAAGAARSVEDSLQATLDIVCSYTGWPLAHALLPEESGDRPGALRATGIWHLENPREYEAFLSAEGRKALGLGKGLPGRAWSSRRVAWCRYTDDPESAQFFRRALEVGLAFGCALPVFHEDRMVAVLEFFSPPVPEPDETMLQALLGAGEQIGRIAARLEAGRELDQLNRRLLELNEEKNQFVAIASHDLKNPLNTLGLTGRMLAEEELPPGEVKGMGRRIADEAQRMTALIQKLLDVTAIESGRYNLRIGETGLGEAILRAQARFQEAAGAKGQAIALDLGGGEVLVRADPEYLQEIVDNLVSNALKFMPCGPPVHSVHLSIRAEAGQGVLEVRDEGPGFSAHDQARAFGRYVKLGARPTGGESSSGLGLFIIRKLVERMEGRVELDSHHGRGSTFRVSLPLAAE